MVIPSKFLPVGFGEKTASQRHLKLQAVVVDKKRGTRINQLMSPGRSDIKTRNTVTVRTHHFLPMERRLSFFRFGETHERQALCNGAKLS